MVPQVKKQLFGLDNKGLGSEVAVKNELRRTIQVTRAALTSRSVSRAWQPLLYSTKLFSRG